MARVIFKNKDGVGILKIEGKFTDSFEKFDKPILNYIEECKNKEGIPKIIIDLTETTFLNATGLGALLWVFTQNKNLNRKTILVKPSEKVMDLLLITKLSTVFIISPSMEEALKNN